jgi:hypothetical protein
MSRERAPLRRLFYDRREDLQELDELGVSKRELKGAVQRCHAEGQLPKGMAPEFLALVIAAELADTAELPRGVNWDRIIELINNLMPLIETWMAMCL